MLLFLFICIVPALFFSVSYGFLHLYSACLLAVSCLIMAYSICIAPALLPFSVLSWLSPSVKCLPCCLSVSYHGFHHLWSACLVAFQCLIMAFTICEVPALLPFSVLSWLSPSVKCLPCCLSVSYHGFHHLWSACLVAFQCLIMFSSICVVPALLLFCVLWLSPSV